MDSSIAEAAEQTAQTNYLDARIRSIRKARRFLGERGGRVRTKTQIPQLRHRP